MLHIPFSHHSGFSCPCTGIKRNVAIDIEPKPLTLIEWNAFVAQRASPPRRAEGQIERTLQKEHEELGTG